MRTSAHRAEQGLIIDEMGRTTAERRPMGIDYLDMECRILRRLGIRLDRDRVGAVASHRGGDLTVGDLFALICERCPDAGVCDAEMDEDDIWLILQQVVAETFGVEPFEVSEDRWLVGDFGMA